MTQKIHIYFNVFEWRTKAFYFIQDIERMMSDVTKQDWEMLNSVFQATPLPTFIWQASNADDFELIDFNKAAGDFAGEKLKDSLIIKASLYYKDEPGILADLNYCHTGKTTVEREIAYGMNSYGDANFLNVKYLFIQPDIILVQLQEISKLKEVSKKLTDHIKQQAAFIENSPAAIAMFDKEMRYISASNSWVTDYNLKGKEIIGKSHYAIFPQIQDDWKAIHQRCLNGAVEKREEDSFVGVDGELVWLKWEIHPWYHDSKEVGGIVMFTEDISERKAKEDLIEEMNEKLVTQNELLKQAKEKIELNEIRLIEAQHAAKIGSWETDLSTMNVVWSEETFSIFELDSKEFSPTHDSFLSFVHEEDKEEVNDAFESSFSSTGYTSIEHRIISAKGNLKYLEEHWRVLKDEQGDPIRVFGSCQDITERKLIELELNHSRRQLVENEYRLKLAIDTGKLGVWDWDLLEDEVIWKGLMNEIYGIKQDFISNKYQAWVDSLHPEDREMEINKLHHAVENSDTYHTAFRIVKGNGDIAHIKSDLVVLRNESKEPYRIIGINQDITAQKNAENKLVAYKHFFQNSKDFLNISNTKGYCEVVNPQMIKVLGYSEEELLSKPYYELIHPDDQAAMSAEVEELSKGNETQNLLIRHRKKSGEYISIEWNVIPDEQTGKIYCIGRDITERKKSLDLIRYQFENAPDIILIVNRDFTIESINRGIFSKKEDLIGKYCLDFLPVESRGITEETIKKCMETGERYEIENTVGQDRWVRSRFVPMVIDGEINQVMIFGSEITSQKQAEQKLKESEEKYRAITENIDDAILLIDKDFNLIYRSPPNYKITGYTDEDFENLDITTLVQKEDLEKSLLDFQRVYESPFSSISFKVRVLHKLGHWLWIEGSIVNMISNQVIKAIVVSFRDVTARVKVEEELALASLIVNSTEDVIVSKSNENIITSWNHGAEKAFGYTAEQAIGQSIYLLIPESLHEEERMISENISNAKSVIHLETQRIHKDGNVIDVSLTISPILNESGKVIGSSKIIRDITERKKLEHERNKVIDELVKRNRDLEQFSYIVSHNLRAPVANILGISNLIQSHDLFESEKDLVSGLAQSAFGLDTVIRDLNYILKKKRELNENKVHIRFGELIESVQSNISSWINQEKVTFITDFSSKDGMLTIKSYLFSVLYNLISNSIKYKHPDRDPIIEIKSYLKENGFKIIVRDNGLGIDLNKSSEELFGLYKRFHFHIEGKGMGLYMVKTQIEAIGGIVYMKSEVNIGTEVTIEFENE